MKNLIAGFAIAVLIACAVLLFLQHQAQEKLRAEDGLLRQQIAQLKTDNENLSNHAAAKSNSESLPNDQFNELLKLRGEVGVLRRQLESQKAPVAQKAQAAQQSAPIRDAATARPAPSAYVSKDQLTNAGFDTPEAALQTYFHGIVSGNYEQFVGAMSAQFQVDALKNPKDREGFAQASREGASSFQGIQTLAKKIVSDDKVDVEILVFQEGKAPDMSIEHVVREGNQWKFAGSANVGSSWSKDGQVQSLAPFANQ